MRLTGQITNVLPTLRSVTSVTPWCTLDVFVASQYENLNQLTYSDAVFRTLRPTQKTFPTPYIALLCGPA